MELKLYMYEKVVLSSMRKSMLGRKCHFNKKNSLNLKLRKFFKKINLSTFHLWICSLSILGISTATLMLISQHKNDCFALYRWQKLILFLLRLNFNIYRLVFEINSGPLEVNLKDMKVLTLLLNL